MTAPAPRYADPATIAASLRRIADAIETVNPALFPRDPYVSIDIQPGGGKGNDAATIAIIDALGTAILGQSGTSRSMGGSHHHQVTGNLPGVSVSIYDRVASPEESALQAEIDELRRRRDALAAELGEDRPAPGEGSAS